MKCSTCGMKECCGGELESELSRYREAVKVMRDAMDRCIGTPCLCCDEGIELMPCTCVKDKPFYEIIPEALLEADRILKGEK